MITYVYKCTNESCKHYDVEFEVKQRMSDDKLTQCEDCLADSLVRVIQPTQAILKGDGWPGNYMKGIHHVNGKEKGMPPK